MGGGKSDEWVKKKFFGRAALYSRKFIFGEREHGLKTALCMFSDHGRLLSSQK